MDGQKTVVLQQVRREMSGEEAEEASRECSFRNLVSEGKERKVTRGECG